MHHVAHIKALTRDTHKDALTLALCKRLQVLAHDLTSLRKRNVYISFDNDYVEKRKPLHLDTTLGKTIGQDRGGGGGENV